jgi:LPXTG-motif cell wall-anchored protein
MNTTERTSKRSGGAIVALLLLSGLAGAAFAAPVPSTTDHRNATTPMITGSARLVNEHQLLVETEQGEEVLLGLDSRTMVPADLAQGMMMRVEFKYLEDGSRLAERVIPIRGGQKTTRELAYSNERENGEETLHYASTDQPEERAETHASHAASATNQPLGTPLRPVPNTEAYRIATQPMLAGEVAMVNDHKLVIDTDQGHSVPVEMDSRTLIPSDLQSGMGVRVEYKTMEDGTKLATRVVPLRDYEVNEREMATGVSEENEENEENGAMPANNVERSSTTAANESEAMEQAENAGNGHEVANQENEAGEHELPKTASNLPLVALLGLASLAAAGALAARRYFRVG